MAFPLSQKFLEKLREDKPEDSYREAYISKTDKEDTEVVCIDGWFELKDLEKILEGIVEVAVDEADYRREHQYPFEM